MPTTPEEEARVVREIRPGEGVPCARVPRVAVTRAHARNEPGCSPKKD